MSQAGASTSQGIALQPQMVGNENIPPNVNANINPAAETTMSGSATKKDWEKETAAERLAR